MARPIAAAYIPNQAALGLTSRLLVMPPTTTFSTAAVAPSYRAQAVAAELRSGVGSASETFGAFCAFQVSGENQGGVGRARSSIDVGHAARLVADHLIEA